jgi:hypothetical protein
MIFKGRRYEAFLLSVFWQLYLLKLDSSLGGLLKPAVPFYVLVVYWGFYIGLMAVGLSPDIMGEKVSEVSKFFAHMFFYFGVLLTAFVSFFLLTGLIFPPTISISTPSQIGEFMLAAGFYNTLKGSARLVIKRKKPSKEQILDWVEKAITYSIMILPLFLLQTR